MCLPHKITGATNGFQEESNLIVLVGAKIRPSLATSPILLLGIFSRKAIRNLEVSLLQVMQRTAECLNRNLGGRDTPIEILWKTPKGQEALLKKLPKTIIKFQPALGIVDHLRRRFARFKLCAHLLNLRCRQRRQVFLLLLRNRRFLFCHCDFSCVIVASCSSTLRCSLRNSLSNIAFTAS